MTPDEINVINKLISLETRKLHERIGETVDAFITDEGLGEDNVTLNIVFNALAHNMRALVANNKDIPAESVELMIRSVSSHIRKGYAERVSNQN